MKPGILPKTESGISYSSSEVKGSQVTKNTSKKPEKKQSMLSFIYEDLVTNRVKNIEDFGAPLS